MPTTSPQMLPLTDMLTGLYRSLLRREPDQQGLDAHLRNIIEGSSTIERTIDDFINSEEFQSTHPQIILGPGSLAQPRFFNDHSQFGELEILLREWVNEAASHKIVVDVGARGRDRSNSFDLLKQFGWRGILIEANPALVSSITEEFSGLDIELVNCAISDYDGFATFTVGVNDDVSSLNPENALSWGSVRGEVEIEVKRLHPFLRSRKVPTDFDLLSLDIEGEDLKVLNDLIGSGDYLPRWIIVEASYEYNTKSLDDLPLNDAVKNNYRIVGQTVANLIMRTNT